MGKDKRANDVEDTLRAVGWTTRSEKAKKPRKDENGNYVYVSGEREGEPDVLAIRRGTGVFVEIKTFRQAFRIDKYSEEQINWALDAIQNRSENVWVWFFGGGDPPNYDHTKKNKDDKPYQPRKAWLMPFIVMHKTFKLYEGRQKSIPYGNQLKMNPYIREHRLHFLGMFKRYEMIYETGNNWLFCREHPFAEQFMPDADFPPKHERRFNEGDEVRVTGYNEVFEIVALDEWSWDKDCWLYKIRSWQSEMKFDGVPEDTMYLAGG